MIAKLFRNFWLSYSATFGVFTPQLLDYREEIENTRDPVQAPRPTSSVEPR